MAAIAGIIAINGEKVQDCNILVEDMLFQMRHRGPDNVSLRTLPDGRGALGAVEINLTAERTACSALTRPPYILFDGELFNHRENGMTDVELFRSLYMDHGIDCLHHLDGAFTCAIVDDGQVILARDPVGARPLFYWQNDDLLYFSTEMKGLVDYCQYDVAELPPGYLYDTTAGLQQFQPYIPDVPDPGDDIKAAAVILRDLLTEAVKKRMPGVNAVSLSGGLDSSIIAAIAKEYNPHLHLFTATIDSAPGPDLENAKLMADFLGMEHHIYRITNREVRDVIVEAIWHLESFDEDCISGMISNYYVSKMLKGYSNLALVGEGADELFGGYRMVLKNPAVKDADHREELAQKLLEIAYNTALRRLDRAWMANAVVYQTPYLDAKVIAFSQKIPMAWKIYGEQQIEKYILREAFRDLLPEQIANREKLRFAMGVGTDDVMDSIISEIIDPNKIKERPSTHYGLPFASFKELYYYDEFLKLFPAVFEKQTIRWDPWK
jgi:asparagine synthase (glutamine-hydrolysing)